MLNNRQQSGRRRGRGGQRQQGNGGRSPEQGNRIDNRARGNAPQMLEKYKTLARDSQMAGDRVMTEYYHQFADHYFRVVAETRARFEEQRRQRGDWQDDDDGYDGEERADNDDQNGDYSDDQEGQRDADPRRGNRDYVKEQGRDQNREQGRGDPRDQNRDQNREQGRDQNRNREPQRDQQRDPQRQPRENRPRDDVRPREEARPREEFRPREESRPREEAGNRDAERASRPRRPRDDRNGNLRAEREDEPATIDIAVLPPSFGSDGPIMPVADLPMGLEGESDEAPTPKRRGRPRKVAVDAEAN